MTMLNTKLFRGVFLILAGLAFGSELQAAGWSADLPIQMAARKAQQDRAGASLSADEAAAIASRATGGRVLKVQPGGSGYSVRVLLSNGQVRTVHVGADGSVRD